MTPLSTVLEGNLCNEDSVSESGPDLALKVISLSSWGITLWSRGMVATGVCHILLSLGGSTFFCNTSIWLLRYLSTWSRLDWCLRMICSCAKYLGVRNKGWGDIEADRGILDLVVLPLLMLHTDYLYYFCRIRRWWGVSEWFVVNIQLV